MKTRPTTKTKRPEARKLVANVTPEAADSPEAHAARATQCGSQLDAALLQSLRENAWRILAETKNPEAIAKIFPLILAARRQNACERQAVQRTLTEDELNEALDAEIESHLRLHAGRDDRAGRGSD